MEENINEFRELVLGDKSVAFYLAAFFFSGLAILLSLYIHSRKRDPLSPNTPSKFSWYFLIWDNTKRIVVGLIVMFFLYRFTPFVSMELAVGVGFFVSIGVDQAIQYLMKKYEFLQMDRTQLPTKSE